MSSFPVAQQSASFPLMTTAGTRLIPYAWPAPRPSDPSCPAPARHFRERWDAYRPCPHRGDAPEAFQVTFADGHTVAKPLDHPLGDPRGPACDRATRDSVSGIGEDLEKRYFR